MNIITVTDYQAMSDWACQHLIKRINELEQPVLGLATGSTPEGMYSSLINAYQNKQISFENVISFNLDEYVGLPSDDHNSYNYFMHDKLFNHIDIKGKNAHLPNGIASSPDQECQDYEKLITQTNGIDLQILGIGLNGHIGFNEPGTPFSSRTHVVELDDLTREANARFFASKDDVPTHAITMGIATIMESKEIILLISGENKAEALKQLIESDVTEDFPASILQKHPNLTIVADEAAAHSLVTK
ncbi:glucosamine-6-phosphate deaminase [Amphibacillus marinus]|uniref:Glucosamine-6-phosphate deaminase n=1 Tax=Amphibacillus marinus TaxID=872970 RepID=A0A1H8MKB8_9BACI|nr:glucosamine-6-phosphate deaminase [Amphibacillus marinus]SEO17596.1 glucosamine-6-phosphate deaminase [Amphibacillus marinus]